jgi:two-component system sensor histidine kinase UhpB
MTTTDNSRLRRAHSSAARLFTAIGNRWYEFPVRWQILIAISILTLTATLVSGIFAVLDARERAAIETRSNIELWSRHISTKAKEIEQPSEIARFASRLETEMANVRHVSVRVFDPTGQPLRLSPLPIHNDSHEATRERAPDWFVKLVQPDIETHSVNIVEGGQHLATVLITGVPDDEIAEAWELLQVMGLLWLAAIGLMTVGLYFILGLILDPLAKLGGGMRELEDGHYAFRLQIPRVRELAAIAGNFNTLAAALDKANAENGRLYRQLIAVQEDERREMSRDLHDEFGPCLFGIMAGTAAIERHAKHLPPPDAAPILACVQEIVQVSDHLKGLNRALLNRLRPVALGRSTLEELINELVATFKRRHGDIRFEQDFHDLPTTFGEAIDLAVYRCVQEALTNAIRHGQAMNVGVEIFEGRSDAGRNVSVKVTDDGAGIQQSTPIGYGLSGMRERVRSLAGSLSIEPNAPRGTIISVAIPVTDKEKAKSDGRVLSHR